MKAKIFKRGDKVVFVKSFRIGPDLPNRDWVRGRGATILSTMWSFDGKTQYVRISTDRHVKQYWRANWFRLAK